MKKKCLLTVFVTLLCCFQLTSQNGKLNSAKKSLNSSNTTSNTSVSITTSRNTTTVSNNNMFADDIENPFLRAVWYVFGYTVFAVFVESPWEKGKRMSDAEIANYPYKKPSYGNFIYTNTTDYNITRFDIYNRFLVENKQLYGNNLGVNFRFLKRFALDANYVVFREKLATNTTNFEMFSSLLKYHRVRTQRFDAWFGIGFTRVFSSVNKTRALFGFGGELFVTKPISMVASHKWATMNNLPVNTTKLLLKYHIKNYRIAVGYEGFKLGKPKIEAFSIGLEASF